MSNNIALRPYYCASISGGKDSWYMLKVILSNLTKYPLDCVVHYELEIDYPFVKSVIDFIESECKRFNIPFIRIKPRKTWEELYYTVSGKSGYIYGFPTRIARWCNSLYKMDCVLQLREYLKNKGFYLVSYIGYCADEENRYFKRIDLRNVERYPLVEEGVIENDIWFWAKSQPIYNNYYRFNKRLGCMYCPMSGVKRFTYLYKFYPEQYNYMITKMRETELLREKQYGRPFSVIRDNPKYNSLFLDNQIKNKYSKLLDFDLKHEQLDFFNCML